LSFKNLEFTALDLHHSVYNVTGNWKISGKDSSGGFFSLIFRKQKGNWKIITDHTW
jgi:ketosteroid isomerase-like protein